MAHYLPPDALIASLAECPSVQLHLDAFVDGELTALDAHDRPLTQVVASHLGECKDCARLERQLTRLRATLRAVGRRERATARASDALRARAAKILSSR